MEYYYGVNIKEQKKRLLKSSVAKPLIEDIIKKADAALSCQYRALKMSEYMMFIETGDRKVFEDEYFKRRNDCSYISIAYWLTEDEKYRKALIDLIFYICDEYTWCLPAHAGLQDNPTADSVVGMLDLFQAETARLLTDIDVIAGDKLPYYVNDRIEYEIRRRIINHIEPDKYIWQNKECTHNWAAVCAGGIGVALLHYATDKEKEKILPLLDDAMERFLRGYNDDGCCLEGYSYWNYGFGYYLLYAMAVLDYSDGKINMLNNEKVKQIALYPQRIRMGKTKTVSFSDGGNDFVFSPGVVCLLRKFYGDEVLYPPLELGTLIGNVYSVKELLWLDTEYKEDESGFLTTFFKDSQWYVKQGMKYSFAAKGGYNLEPHNHNDVGSFMIVTNNDDIPLADLGAAIYRKETFDPNLRYSLLNNSSRGHSVPIVNGEYQLAGNSFRAENVKAGEDFFETDIEGAYESGIVKRIKRRFTLKETSIVLCDMVEYSDRTQSITERFVSWTKPHLCDGYVDLKTARIVFDKEKYNVSISNDCYQNHKNAEEVDVFFIDFKAVNPREERFEYTIEL